MNNAIKILSLMIMFALISLFFGANINRFFIKISQNTIDKYYSLKGVFIDNINEHFNQEKEIKKIA